MNAREWLAEASPEPDLVLLGAPISKASTTAWSPHATNKTRPGSLSGPSVGERHLVQLGQADAA